MSDKGLIAKYKRYLANAISIRDSASESRTPGTTKAAVAQIPEYEAIIAALEADKQRKPAGFGRPKSAGMYAWRCGNAYALVVVDKRGSDCCKKGVLCGKLMRSTPFYDGCEIEQWTGEFTPLNVQATIDTRNRLTARKSRMKLSSGARRKLNDMSLRKEVEMLTMHRKLSAP